MLTERIDATTFRVDPAVRGVLPLVVAHHEGPPETAELGERKVQTVRVSCLVHVESGEPTAGMPHLAGRVLVTAAIEDGVWAEYRYWIGRSLAELGERGLRLPARLEDRTAAALAEIIERVAAAGFQVRDGIYTHDRGTLDSFRL